MNNSPLVYEPSIHDQAVGLLAALQLADSFFPSGMYTQSHGLEAFVAAGLTGEQALLPLLRTYLLEAAAPGDALAARCVARAAATDDLALIELIDGRLEATKLAAEGRLASRRCGGRVLLLATTINTSPLLRRYSALVQGGEAPGHQAVALALLAAASGLAEEAAVLIELHGFAVSLLSAAVRLGALDHIAAQRLLVALRPVLAEAAGFGRERSWQEIGGFAPQIEQHQFAHRYADLHSFVS